MGIGATERVVNPVAILRHVASIPWNGRGQGRYLEDTRDPSKETALLEIDEVDDRIHGKIAHFRRDARPHFEKRGTGIIQIISELDFDDGIVEITHFILYPKLGLLAIEYNHFGPRCSTLSNYLPRKAGHLVNRIDWSYIVNSDFRQRLQEFSHEGISKAEIQIKASKLGEIESVDTTVYNAAKAVKALGDPEILHLKLGPEPRSGSKINIIENIRNLGHAIFPQANTEPITAVKGFKITAQSSTDGQSKAFDLLEEDLVAEIEVVRQDSSRTIDSEDMFNRIHSAFIYRKAELLKAVGVKQHDIA